jgi:hypothetical protein
MMPFEQTWHPPQFVCATRVIRYCRTNTKTFGLSRPAKRIVIVKVFASADNPIS